MFAIENLYQSLAQFRGYIDQGWLRIGSGYGAQAVQWSSDSEMQALFDQFPSDPRKMHWFRVSKIGAQAKNYKSKELERCRKRLLKTHEQLVSSGVSQAVLLEMLVIQLVGKV